MLHRIANKFFFGALKDSILNQQTSYGNITPKIAELAERKLYKNPKHPIGIIKKQIEEYFLNDKYFKGNLQNKRKIQYGIGDNFDPIVTVKQNFDDLLIPKDHVSRKRSDTYYLSQDLLMRPHVTANEKDMFDQGNEAFLIFADCFRRDEIDATHYPVFHQMEAVRTFKPEDFETDQRDVQIQLVMEDLKSTYENLVKYLFGDSIQMRWVPAYFPFTEPSLELEIFWNGEWLEMLGCGILRQDVMKNFNRPSDEIAWASGCGLERFAILLFQIDDIRMFWSQDLRFLNQFKDGKIVKFEPFSKYPACYKDVSFYIPEELVDKFEENDLFEIIRGEGGDLIEKVELTDTYHNKKQKKVSKCFRIHYRSLEKTLTNEEIDDIQFKIRDNIQSQLKYELR